MSREEAIKELTELLPEEFLMEYSEAIRMAIKALEQEPVFDKIRAEIDSHCSDNRDRNDGLYIAMRIIEKYQASLTLAESEE